MRQHVNPLSSNFNQVEIIPSLCEMYGDSKLNLHLDIGCAAGEFLFDLALVNTSWNYLGIEIREKLVKTAKLKVKVLNVFNQLSIWLSFQLSIIFLVGIPVTLFFWSIKKRNKAVNKLLSIYWKISLLFFISLLLLIGKYKYALLITNISTLLITISIWFWNDINDELKEYDFSYSLTTTTKIW